MDKQGISINVQMPMDKMAWLQNGGGHGWSTPAPGKIFLNLVHHMPLIVVISPTHRLYYQTLLLYLTAYMKESLVSLLPWLSSSTYTGSFNADQLRQTIRAEFRHPSSTNGSTSNTSSIPTPTTPDPLDRAFTSLRVLEEQLHMARCSSAAATDSIRVDVCSAFVGTQADLDPTYDPDDEAAPPKMYYTYRVRVSNTGQVTILL